MLFTLPFTLVASLMSYFVWPENRKVVLPFGDRQPNFLDISYNDAVKKTKEEFRFLFVYLHAPFHPDTLPFCKQTLCSEQVASYLERNFVPWAADIRSAEGANVASALDVIAYPFTAIICHCGTSQLMQANLQALGYSQLRRGGSLLLWQRKGNIAPNEFLRDLAAFVDRHEPLLVAAKAEKNEVAVNRTIMEQQNFEYEESLRIDREKELKRQRDEAEKKRMEEEEKERIRRDEEERQRRKEDEERRQKLVAERKERLEAHIADEPPASEATTEIVIRLCDGTRLKRRFLRDDKLASLFLFIASKEEVSEYVVVTHFPRVVLTDGELSFNDAKLSPQASVFVEEMLA